MSDQLIICGMHRSGTSLVASILATAGLDIGSAATGPELGQPRGHFEDGAFSLLHDEILARAGHTCFSADETAIASVPPDFAARAAALVAARSGRPFWGWKDPRTTLFPELWAKLLPRARFLFLYRHPVDVALSLWRRDTDLEIRRDPMLAFRAWTFYNRQVLAFHERQPGRCFVGHAPAIVVDLAGFVQRLASRLELPLRAHDFGGLVDDGELAPSCREPRPNWAALVPEALSTYDRLEAIADVPSAGEPVATGRQRSLVQASERLLHALVAGNPGGGVPLPGELRAEWLRLRVQEEALEVRFRADHSALVDRLDEGAAAIAMLREIEGSRAFALVRAWWALRRRLGRDAPGAAPVTES